MDEIIDNNSTFYTIKPLYITTMHAFILASSHAIEL